MQERSPIIVGALVVVLTLFPLGFLVHVSPRFPGSLTGSLIGIAAALLMLVPMIYVIGKHIPIIHRWLDKRIETRTLLAVHIYAGVMAPILGLAHAAHKFNSPMGISLTGILLVMVISGYVGRYLLLQIGRGIRGRTSELATLRASLARLPPTAFTEETSETRQHGWFTRFFLTPSERQTEQGSAVSLAEALADVEYAVRSENVANTLFNRWRRVHIILATLLYTLLVLHIWSGVYYGLRWL